MTLSPRLCAALLAALILGAGADRNRILGSADVVSGIRSEEEPTRPDMIAIAGTGDHALHVAGQLGGDVRDIAVVGDRAVAGVGPRLVALDISGEGDPRVVAATPPLDGMVTDVWVHDDLVVCTTAIAANDVTDSLSPRRGSSLHVVRFGGSTLELLGKASVDGVPAAVWTNGRIAAVAAARDADQGTPDSGQTAGVVWTYDITAGSPRRVGRADVAIPMDLAATANHLVVLGREVDAARAPRQWWLVLQMVDIGDPGQPIVVSSLRRLGQPAGTLGGLAIGASHAFVATLGPEGLQAISLEDAEHPRLVGQLGVIGADVAWLDGILYVASPVGSSAIVDASNPGHLVASGGFAHALIVAGHGQRLAAYYGPFTLSVYSRIAVTDLHLLGTWQTVTAFSSMATDGRRLFAAEGRTHVLSILDAGDGLPAVLGASRWEDGLL